MLDNFYTSIETLPTGENTWTVHIRLNAEHPLYKGHFPEQPVVPGVCMLQLIKESVEQILRQRVQYAQVSSCKFLLPIVPVQFPELTLALELKELPEQGIQIQAEGKAGDEYFIKLKAKLVTR